MKKNQHATKAKKQRRVVLLFIISLIFVALAFAIALVNINYIVNQSFTETFYNTSSMKVNNKIRVIQISDPHSCTYGENNSQLVERVQKLKPDLIIFTGDCMDSGSNDMDGFLALCAQLAQIAPSYYIYGNNEVDRCYGTPLTRTYLDAWFGFDDQNRDPKMLSERDDPFSDALKAQGVKVLKNQHDTVTIGNTTVDVYGVLTSNPSSFWPYAGDSFSEYLYTNENHLKITAMHEPQILEVYEPDFWGDLMLAGHTHGGVMQVPMVGPLYTAEGGLFPEWSDCYVYGRYDVLGRPLIVSSGLDNSAVYRINNQPEIVIVDINRY